MQNTPDSNQTAERPLLKQQQQQKKKTFCPDEVITDSWVFSYSRVTNFVPPITLRPFVSDEETSGRQVTRRVRICCVIPVPGLYVRSAVVVRSPVRKEGVAKRLDVAIVVHPRYGRRLVRAE